MSTILHKTACRSTSVNTLADHAYEQIKEAIVCGKLEQGSKIVEEDMARSYGISRGPLREAINRLDSNRLVVRKPHAGVRVITLTYPMMKEIYIVREALEGMSARLAARNMDTVNIDALYLLLDGHETGIHETSDAMYFQREGDLDFHYRISAAGNNELLQNLLASDLYQLLRMSRYSSARKPDRPLQALGEHHQIVDAIAKGDEELSEMLMRRHISGAWEIVKKILPEASEKTGNNDVSR